MNEKRAILKPQAIEAVDLLNDFFGDLWTSVNMCEHFFEIWGTDNAKKPHLDAIFRVCASQIILTLFKWIEFYEKYHALIPDDMKGETKQLLKKIKSREVELIRHTYIGHIWHKTKNRPLYNTEIDELLCKVTLGHAGNFMKWIHNYEDNTYPKTVVSIVVELRDRISQEFNVDYVKDVLGK